MINIIRLLNIVVDIWFDSQNANLEILYCLSHKRIFNIVFHQSIALIITNLAWILKCSLSENLHKVLKIFSPIKQTHQVKIKF